ncbi:MAG: M1 family metallopeptidase [Actinomycetota bacterium]
MACAALLASCTSSSDEAIDDPAPETSRPESSTTTAPVPPRAPVAGPSVGDRFVPGAGSAGIDVERYEVALDVTDGGAEVRGEARITLRADQDLGGFHLDLVGLDVEDVAVDGEPVEFVRTEDELRIELPATAEAGSSLVVDVVYGGRPEPLVGVVSSTPVGWSATPWGGLAVSQPRGTATWMPVADHPSDPATWSIELTTDDPLVGVASGRLADRRPAGEGRTVHRWVVDEPMAPHVALAMVADVEIETPRTIAGIPVTVAAAPPAGPVVEEALDRLPAIVEAFERWFGPYPLDGFGLAVAPGPLDVSAPGTQGMALFDQRALDDPAAVVLAHVVAHQWAGNHVTPERWEDVWLSEGLATYGEWLWFEASVGESADVLARLYCDDAGPEGLVPPADPPLDALFGPATSGRGALAFHALRGSVGDAGFEEVLTTWFERFGGGPASTDDLLALVEELHGTDAAELLAAWALDPSPPIAPLRSVTGSVVVCDGS